jgi:hypothetical protein
MRRTFAPQEASGIGVPATSANVIAAKARPSKGEMNREHDNMKHELRTRSAIQSDGRSAAIETYRTTPPRSMNDD